MPAMRAFGMSLAVGVLVAACSQPLLSPQGVAPSASPAATAPAIDKGRAGQIARDFFAGAHASGSTLTNVSEQDLGVTGDTSCGHAWEVLMTGTVTERGGASYGSAMYLCVDPVSGAVTRGPAG
jgi:hypothetical protein